jgi:hypothetical protein
MFEPRPRPFIFVSLLFVVIGCAEEPADEPGDAEDGMFSGPKPDGFCADEGTPEETWILALVNDETTTFEELDRPVARGGAGLKSNAARNIVEMRPYGRLRDLDEVPFVGVVTCGALLTYACEVKDLCHAEPDACDPDAFPPRPVRTRYDAGCEAILLGVLASAPTDGERAVVTDAGGRCEELSRSQRAAFDAVAVDFGSPPATFSDDFGEFSVHSFAGEGDSDVQLVHVIEEDSFTPFHVVFAGDELAAVWNTDGLSAGVEWFCGADAGEAEEPDEFCVGALTDDAASCDLRDADHSAATMSVAEARESETLAAAAVLAHANAHALGDDAELDLEVDDCDGSAAHVSVAAPESPAATYHVVDSTRGLGRTVLTSTTDAGTQILCFRPES